MPNDTRMEAGPGDRVRGTHKHEYKQHPKWPAHAYCVLCGFAVVKSALVSAGIPLAPAAPRVTRVCACGTPEVVEPWDMCGSCLDLQSDSKS